MERPASSDPAEIQALLWAGWSGQRAFDVGANCGQSVQVLRGRFDEVVAFEPADESWELLVRDWGYAQGVRLVHAALSDTSAAALVELYETPNNLAQGQLISPGHHAFTREVEEPGARLVPAMTMDEAMVEYGAPDFVKIDTEGHELRILQGAPRALADTQAGFLIEFHSPVMHDECARLLEAAGRVVTTVRHPHYPQGSEDWYNHGWIRAS